MRIITSFLSFMKEDHDLMKMDKNLNTICDVGNGKFYGDIQVVFAGDFCQLSPPREQINHFIYAKIRIFLEKISTLFFTWEPIIVFKKTGIGAKFWKDSKNMDQLLAMLTKSALDLCAKNIVPQKKFFLLIVFMPQK